MRNGFLLFASFFVAYSTHASILIDASVARQNFYEGKTDFSEMDTLLLKLNESGYKNLSLSERREKVDELSQRQQYAERKSYTAKVNTKTNDFAGEPLFPRLHILVSDLAEIVGAEFLLSKYAQKWAYKTSQSNGPNCYHTSMASIFLNWDKHRYMGPSEFKCHLNTSFAEIPKPEKYGDLIGIFSSSGSPIHGFTYLGPDRKTPGNILVFTKNGYAQSRYLFMTYKDVYQIYGSSSTKVKYYRPIKEAIDPSSDPKAPCANTLVRSPLDEPTLELPNASFSNAF